jgi:hypothetical protein
MFIEVKVKHKHMPCFKPIVINTEQISHFEEVAGDEGGEELAQIDDLPTGPCKSYRLNPTRTIVHMSGSRMPECGVGPEELSHEAITHLVDMTYFEFKKLVGVE